MVAPRAMASPEELTGCLAWPARFVPFIVRAVLGIGWLTAVTT